MIGLLGKEQREFARRMHEVQRMGMVSVQNAGGSRHGEVTGIGNIR